MKMSGGKNKEASNVTLGKHQMHQRPPCGPIVSSIGVLQWAHSVRTVTVSCSFRNRPCTKGVANASAAQAAYTCSPELKVR